MKTLSHLLFHCYEIGSSLYLVAEDLEATAATKAAPRPLPSSDNMRSNWKRNIVVNICAPADHLFTDIKYSTNQIYLFG